MIPYEAGAAPPLARSTRRPAADFDEYVLRYARVQRANVFLVFAGVGLAVGAAVQLHGGLMVTLAAVGLGIAGAGAGGLMAAMSAHNSYTRYLGSNETQEYAPPAPPAEGVRPFVPSSNGAPTIRAGRFSLPAATWAALLAAAEANGGRLTRDAATKVLPRALYRDWATTAGEFQRLGMIDGDGMVTPAGRGMMRGGSPFPTGDYAPTGAHSTHARRTHDAHGVVWGES
jgi:hypothetical protein